MAFFKTVFKSIGKALDWISADDDRLRAARARGQNAGDTDNKKENESQVETDKRSEEERYADEYDVWEEIDSYRTTFWFGSKVGRMMSRSRKRGEKLEKELEELERKRQMEKEKGEGKEKT
jgi:hypothetical protein